MNGLGERLKKIRVEKAITQEQLGELCETSGIAIRSIEKSRRYPSYNLLVRLCNVLKVSPEHLMQDDLKFACGNDEKEVLNYISKLTPKQLKMLKDILAVSTKYTDMN